MTRWSRVGQSGLVFALGLLSGALYRAALHEGPAWPFTSAGTDDEGVVERQPSPIRFAYRANPLHGEWAPETDPNQFTAAELFPPPELVVPVADRPRRSMDRWGDQLIDRSHAEFTVEPWPATKAGLQALLRERRSVVAECEAKLGMSAEVDGHYDVTIWPQVKLPEVRAFVPSAAFASSLDEEDLKRAKTFGACLCLALSSAEFQVRDPDEMVTIEVRLAGPIPGQGPRKDDDVRDLGSELRAHGWHVEGITPR